MVVAAHRTMISRIQEARWTDLERPEVPKNARVEMSPDILPMYIREVLANAMARPQHPVATERGSTSEIR